MFLFFFYQFSVTSISKDNSITFINTITLKHSRKRLHCAAASAGRGVPILGSNKLSRLGESSFRRLPEVPGKTRENVASPETGSSWRTQDILSLSHFLKKKLFFFFRLSQSSGRHLRRKGFYNMSSDVSNPTSAPKLLKYL